MQLTKTNIKKFQGMIFDWWRENRRDLPWRHTHDPYKILVSEVMLQQTQVSRVLPTYRKFVERFPSVASLARESTAEVLRAWKGMGYNRRALYLHQTAQVVMNEYGGKFPKEEKLLTKLPGLGIYTARAVLVFAYKQEVAMVDTNIRQIITHFFFDDIPQSDKAIQQVADHLVPKGKPWEWHQALMDYGALVIIRRKTKAKPIKKVIPFRQSNRFFRGRLIDYLREQSMKETELVTKFSKIYNKTPDFFHTLLSQLVKEKLISRSGELVSLPL